MSKTLNEAFHEILRDMRRLSIEAGGISAEVTANGTISQQKLRRLATLNADAYDTLQVNIITGIGAYASDQLGGVDIAVLKVATEAALITFRDYMIVNLPTPADNGLDANARSTNLTVTVAQMPALVSEMNALESATAWA